MRIDAAATPFAAIAVAPAVLAAVSGWTGLAFGLLALPVAVLLFFRDPERHPPQDPNLVLSPADGRIMHAGPARPGEAPAGEWQQVTIFLSVFDVHINRAPVGGLVRSVTYQPGSFLAAFRAESYRNEHSEITIDHGATRIVVRQVVGLLARRVVCRLKPSQTVAAGDRIGLMKFGSRMDVFLPVTASIEAVTGATVRAGETVIARLAPAGRL